MDHKHRIREAVEPQLRELWDHEPLLNYPKFLRPSGESNELSVLQTVGPHTFAPLVTKALCLQAELDILMLRPERPGGVITSGGDIDNRLKTLFDGLRVPTSLQEISANARPSSEEQPIFTLLQDDALLTRVNIETERLLNADGPEAVRLVMKVP